MILTLRLVTKLTMMSLLVVRPTFAQRRSSPLDSTKTATVRRLLELTNAAEAIGKVMEATASVQRRADRDLPEWPDGYASLQPSRAAAPNSRRAGAEQGSEGGAA